MPPIRAAITLRIAVDRLSEAGVDNKKMTLNAVKAAVSWVRAIILFILRYYGVLYDRTMTVTPSISKGNSSKFDVSTKHGDFVLALSFTLRTSIWELADDAAEQAAANELAEAIVSRHDTSQPYKKVYIFAEHNSLPVLTESIKQIRKYGYQG